ncbi:MAG: hypothetical protein HFJ06_04600 [Lachnospiraceae bacterium]|nr:hypothetical protein [Lachnospiraceae bacterium]
MKKVIKFIAGSMVMLLLTACGNVKKDLVIEPVITQSENVTEESEPEKKISLKNNDEKSESLPRMVCVDDKLFVETSEISSMKRCGNMDFNFDTSVEQGEPAENFQTNFGTGYGGQYSIRENRIEIKIDHEWHVFAYNENNLEGVSLKVTENNSHSITLEISNDTDLEVQYGDAYLLEVFDKDLKTWVSVPYILESVAFHDIAYIVNKGETNSQSMDWTSIYGELEKGKYRIVKEVSDFRETGDYTVHTLTDEFEISGNEF